MDGIKSLPSEEVGRKNDRKRFHEERAIVCCQTSLNKRTIQPRNGKIEFEAARNGSTLKQWGEYFHFTTLNEMNNDYNYLILSSWSDFYNWRCRAELDRSSTDVPFASFSFK